MKINQVQVTVVEAARNERGALNCTTSFRPLSTSPLGRRNVATQADHKVLPERGPHPSAANASSPDHAPIADYRSQSNTRKIAGGRQRGTCSTTARPTTSFIPDQY